MHGKPTKDTVISSGTMSMFVLFWMFFFFYFCILLWDKETKGEHPDGLFYRCEIKKNLRRCLNESIHQRNIGRFYLRQ